MMHLQSAAPPSSGEVTGPGAMNFTENQQGSAILDKLRKQKEAGRFCDVVFHIKSREYLAHRNVLAACSPYFDSMLKMNKVAREHVNVSSDNHEVFEMLLNYVYTGKVVVNGKNVSELLHLANHFLVSKLKDHCCEYLERNMNVNNCFSIRDEAEKCGSVTLGKAAEYFIHCNMQEILENHEVLNFPSTKLESFLMNQTYPITEEQKLYLIGRWVKFDMALRKSSFSSLLRHIQWPKINVDLVYELMRMEAWFGTEETCQYELMNILTVNNLLHPAYYNRMEELKTKLEQLGVFNTNSILEMAISAAVGQFEQDPDEDKDCVSVPCVPNELSTITPSHGDHNADVMSSNEFELAGKKEQSSDKEDDSSDLGALHIDIPCDQDIEGSFWPDNADTSASTEQESPETVGPDGDSKKERRKRKDTPVKIRIPKSKIPNFESFRIPKRRGRPPKKVYSNQRKTTSQVNKQKEPLTEKKQLRTHKPKLKNIVTADLDGFNDSVEKENDSDFDDDDENDYEAENSGDNSDLELPEEKVKSDIKSKRGRRRKSREAYPCDQCDFVAFSPVKVEQHCIRAHKDDSTYTCNICDFECHWNREYYRHMKSHFSGPPYICDFEDCDYGCDRIQALLFHRMIHTDERPYECTVCNLKFRTKNNLTMHLRCHTGEKPFKCDVCQRSFATKNTLDQHSVTHSDMRPYLCDICGFATKYQSHLIAHKRIHSGDVFHCQFPNCNYSTPKRSQLGAHMRIHMSIRSHICSICGRAFVEKSHLVRHERIHMEDKPFKCQQCDYGSTRRDKLKEHVLKHHGENPSVKIPYKPRKPRKQNIEPDKYFMVPMDMNPPPPVINHQPPDPTPVLSTDMQGSRGPLGTEAPQLATLTKVNTAELQAVSLAKVNTGELQTVSLASTVDGRGIGLMVPTMVVPHPQDMDGRSIAHHNTVHTLSDIATHHQQQQQHPHATLYTCTLEPPNPHPPQQQHLQQQEHTTDLTTLGAFMSMF